MNPANNKDADFTNQILEVFDTHMYRETKEEVERCTSRKSKKYFELPYNPKLKQRARQLRKARNLPEVLFWNEVKNRKFKEYDFDRQKIIGNFIVDFYCADCNVVIELDGKSHDTKQEYDAIRDAYLHSLGITVIHIDVKDIFTNIRTVIRELHSHTSLQIR